MMHAAAQMRLVQVNASTTLCGPADASSYQLPRAQLPQKLFYIDNRSLTLVHKCGR